MLNWKTEIKWALMFSVVSLLWMMMEEALGWHDEYIHLQMYLTMLFAIPAILIYVFALLDKSSFYYDGQSSFRRSFISSLKLTLVITLLAPFVQFVISTYITPSYFKNAVAYSVEAGYYPTVEEAKVFFNLESFIYTSVYSALIMGVLTGLVVSYFQNRKSRKDQRKV